MTQAVRTHIAPLDCIVVDGGPKPSIAVVLCHGYGASLTDLAPLAGEWITMLGDDAAAFRFVFPDAPHSLADMGMPSGKAWWPINMARLAEAVQASKFEELHKEIPPGIDEARDALQQVVSSVVSDLPGEESKLVLGGFSQGAMLTMDTVLRGEIPEPKLVIQFSGTVVCQDLWQDAAAGRLADVDVYQSHGTIDPILPYDSAVTLRDLLQGAEVDVDFHSFNGPHTIDMTAVEKVAVKLKALVA